MVSELSSFMPGRELLQAKSTESGTRKDNTTYYIVTCTCASQTVLYSASKLNYFYAETKNC